MQPITIEKPIHFTRVGSGAAKHVKPGPAPVVNNTGGRVPRVSRLMALAIRFDKLLRERAIKDYAELARLGHVTRARMTQIMNLLMLAPDIQEQILHFPETVSGRHPIILRDLQPIAMIADWKRQRKLFADLLNRMSP